MKKGGAYLTVIMAIMILLFGFLFVGFIDSEVKSVQNETYTTLPGLNCGNTTDPTLTVSDGTKVTCLITDTVTPYYIFIVLALIGGLIATAFLRGK